MGNRNGPSRRVIALGILVAGLVLALGVPGVASAAGVLPVYRFFNVKTGTHFYTISETEKNNVIATLSSTYNFENVAYYVDTDNPTNNVPLYRFFNTRNGVHFYTASETEKSNIIAMNPWFKFENVAYYVSMNPVGATTVYRFFNLRNGTHFYTASEAEKNNVQANMSPPYKFEGTAFYLNGTLPTPPPPDMPWHQSRTAFCATGAGCHYPSLTQEHYRYPVGAAPEDKLNCQTCHNNADTNVAGTIAVGSDSCIDCHFLTLNTPKARHPGTEAAHTRTNDCTVSGCHSSDMPETHKGDCRPCHENGVVVAAGATCTDCHGLGTPNGDFHVDAAIAHAAADPLATCTVAGCHHPQDSTDVSVVHEACANCHTGIGTPVIAGCTEAGGCHADSDAAHLASAPQHQTGSTCVTPVCHGGVSDENTSSVVPLHETVAGPNSPNPAPGCAACHEGQLDGSSGVVPTVNCSDAACHPTDPHQPVTMGTKHEPPTGAGFAGCWLSPTCHAFNTDVSLFHIASRRTSDFNTWGCRACHSGVQDPAIKDCYECHDVDGVHAVVNADFAVTQASRHNISGAGGGVKTKFDGSQGVLLKDTQENTITTTWEFPLVNVFWAPNAITSGQAPPTAIVGLNKDSVVTCFDCHSGSPTWYAGPHGSSAQWLIDKNYPGAYKYATLGVRKGTTEDTSTSGIKFRTDMSDLPGRLGPMGPLPLLQTSRNYGNNPAVIADGTKGEHAVICAKCHDLYNAGTGCDGWSNAYDEAESVHGMHAGGVTNDTAIRLAQRGGNQGRTDGRGDCINCHIAIPHGWKRPRLLVNGFTGEYPSGGTETTPAAFVASVADPYPYWQGRGQVMANGNSPGNGPLAATEDHLLNSQGVPVWDEQMCIACSADRDLNELEHGNREPQLSNPAKLK
jgi:hypothetical protein